MTVFTMILAGMGCAQPDPAVYEQALDLTSLEYRFHTENTGVHPHDDVLMDPNNPFTGGLGGDTNEDGAPGDGKWEVESTGLAVPRFYAWATVLVSQPTGEHQYFAAAALRDIFATALDLPKSTKPKGEASRHLYKHLGNVLEVYARQIKRAVSADPRWLAF